MEQFAFTLGRGRRICGLQFFSAVELSKPEFDQQHSLHCREPLSLPAESRICAESNVTDTRLVPMRATDRSDMSGAAGLKRASTADPAETPKNGRSCFIFIG